MLEDGWTLAVGPSNELEGQVTKDEMWPAADGVASILSSNILRQPWLQSTPRSDGTHQSLALPRCVRILTASASRFSRVAPTSTTRSTQLIAR